MYHNDFEKSPRGIIVYVDCRLKSKQLFLNSKAVEHLIMGFGNLRTANWRTGNMRTNSANYGREPRVQCEP